MTTSMSHHKFALAWLLILLGTCVVLSTVALGGCDAISNKVKCRSCDGTGDCRPCGGDGKHVIWASGCSHCANDGVCTDCNGYGYTLD